jgi:hypothetical protein
MLASLERPWETGKVFLRLRRFISLVESCFPRAELLANCLRSMSNPEMSQRSPKGGKYEHTTGGSHTGSLINLEGFNSRELEPDPAWCG